MDEILRSHLIDPEMLRADDFEALFDQRARALIGRIEAAVGKTITVEAEVFGAPDEYEEEAPEWEENGGFDETEFAS